MGDMAARLGGVLTRLSTVEADVAAIDVSALDTRLDALEAFRATNEVVRDYTSPADSTISTTETVEATCTLPVPAGWGGYTLEAEASFRINETGTLTAIRLITVRIRLTNASGTQFGIANVVLDLATPNNQLSSAVVGSLEGQTTTGNVLVVLTSAIPADTGQTSIADMNFRARAVRTS